MTQEMKTYSMVVHFVGGGSLETDAFMLDQEHHDSLIHEGLAGTMFPVDGKETCFNPSTYLYFQIEEVVNNE